MVYNIAVAVIIKGTKQWDYFKGHQILPQARDNWLSPLPKIYVRPSNSECVCIHKEGHYRGDWLAMMSCEWALIQSLWHPEEKSVKTQGEEYRGNGLPWVKGRGNPHWGIAPTKLACRKVYHRTLLDWCLNWWGQAHSWEVWMLGWWSWVVLESRWSMQWEQVNKQCCFRTSASVLASKFLSWLLALAFFHVAQWCENVGSVSQRNFPFLFFLQISFG